MQLSPAWFLDVLDFKGGALVGADWDFERMCVRLFIEHPDMPEVCEGGGVPTISPSYSYSTYVCGENGDKVHNYQTLQPTRVYPAKSKEESESD